jgi:membrane protease YdiL (CAAX protease family)
MDPEPVPARAAVVRWTAVVTFLAVWMACGWIFHLDSNAYLLLGIPLTACFQWFVRRKPTRALWVREAPPFRLGKKGIAIAVGLSAVPFLTFVGSCFPEEGQNWDWQGTVASLMMFVGAVAAAYAIVNFKQSMVRPLILCLLITSALDAVQWTLFFSMGWETFKPVEGGIAVRLEIFLFSLLQYIVITMVMEEVTFRMLDDHLHGDRREMNVATAVTLSALWAFWHLPDIPMAEYTGETFASLLYVHVPYGICLSYFWRKSGNLLIPGLAHSLGDAVRNALTAGG